MRTDVVARSFFRACSRYRKAASRSFVTLSNLEPNTRLDYAKIENNVKIVRYVSTEAPRTRSRVRH